LLEFGGFKSMDNRSSLDNQEIKSPKPNEMPDGEKEGNLRKRRDEPTVRVSGAKAMKPKKLTLAHMF
jgi:hypothetical protein